MLFKIIEEILVFGIGIRPAAFNKINTEFIELFSDIYFIL